MRDFKFSMKIINKILKARGVRLTDFFMAAQLLGEIKAYKRVYKINKSEEKILKEMLKKKINDPFVIFNEL